MFDDVAIPHLDYATTHGCSLRIVGDHYDRLVKAVVQLLEHVKDQSGVLGVEITGRFIS